jgi:hypothetical protein
MAGADPARAAPTTIEHMKAIEHVNATVCARRRWAMNPPIFSDVLAGTAALNS